MVEHTTQVQIRWSDVDPAGIVFYPRFFEWYDLGCESLFASLGMPWPEAFPKYDIVGVPIVESGSKFLSPARYGDVLTIRSKVAWVKTKTFRMEHEISVGARLCSAGFEVRAWVGVPASPGAPLHAGPIPEDVSRRRRAHKARSVTMSVSRGVEWRVLLKLLGALASTEFASVEKHHPWIKKGP